MDQFYKKRWFILLFATAVVLLSIACYWPGFHGPFILDDLQSLQPARMEQFSWHSLYQLSMQNDSGPLGRPLSIISFALNDYFFGFNAFSFKVINFVLHLLIGLISGIFIYQLTLLQPKGKSLALPIASLTALLWVIHPLQVTTVLYAVQRMTQLCHGFMLLGLVIYLWGRIRWLTHKPYGLSLMFASFLFFPLALLSKETGILMPWYALCIEIFILRFACPEKKQKKILMALHVVLSLGLLFALTAYYFYSLPKFMAFFAERQSSPFLRFLTELKVLVLYLKMIFLPQISQMGFYHDDVALVKGADISVILSGGLLLLLFIIMLSYRKKASVLAFGLAWFFVSHFLESTFLPLELVFEHRNYLALLGLVWIPVYYTFLLGQKAKRAQRYFVGAAALSLLGVLAMLTFLRSDNWSSADKILFTASIQHPQSPRVRIEMANYLLIQKQYEEALAELDYAQKLQPHNLGISLHKMLVYCHAPRLPLALYEDVFANIQHQPITPYTIVVLDALVVNLFNEQCPSIKASDVIPLLHKAQQNTFLRYHPRYQATLYQLEAALQLQEHQLDLSRALLLKSYQANPKNFEPLLQKAKIELLKHREQQAQETLHYIKQRLPSRYAPLDKIAQLEKQIAQAKSAKTAEPAAKE